MAVANVDTSLPRTSDNLDVEMSGTNPEEGEVQDRVPNIPESNLSGTVQVAATTSGSQKSSSKSSSFSYQSETSTLAHEQTPFIDFKLQVVELCHLLWPCVSKGLVPEQSCAASGRGFLGLLKSRKLSRLKSSTPVAPDETAKKEFVVERMSGGSFNRVICITVIDQDADRPEQLILRVPHIAWMSRPDREVATLRYVSQHSCVPVADVKAFAFTCDNPLRDPYVVQSRIAGIDLRP